MPVKKVKIKDPIKSRVKLTKAMPNNPMAVKIDEK